MAMPVSLPQEMVEPELMSIKVYPMDMHEVPLSAQIRTITTGQRYFPNGCLRLRVLAVMLAIAMPTFPGALAINIKLSSLVFWQHFVKSQIKPTPIRPM